MLNKSIANKNKAKRNLLCIIFGFFAVALSLVIIVYNNNYYQIIRDEQYALQIILEPHACFCIDRATILELLPKDYFH